MVGALKRLLKKWSGADRTRVIAVIGVSRQDVEAGVAHALTSETPLPVYAWCAEACDTETIAGCERFTAGVSAARVRTELRVFWPALIIVAWRGERRGLAHKLIPFLVPPFRFVVANEAGGFFPARPASITGHAARRLRDASLSVARRLAHWAGGGGTWLWSVSLMLFGLAAKASPPLVRAIMRRLPAGKPGPALTVPPAGSRYREITFSGRAWARYKVLEAVLDTSIDFIVFRRAGEKAVPEPLIALARESGAFAAGLQIAWSGWRRTIVPRHPFRRLQPGEVTQVMAPWSTLLVVRRDLLERFGVPHALTFGGALLTLFWQAAAAGLPSLVLGQEREITQEPAMELEDAELAVRLSLSPALGSLAAAHPHRARGNVTFSPGHRQEFRNLPRVLVVSPYLPFPLSHGGAVRMYNLCRAMADRVDFVLVCFREATDAVRYDELHQVFRNVYVVDIDEKQTDDSVPLQVTEYRNSAMADLIETLCLSGSVDAVQLEYTQMAEYARHAGALPVILVEHDLTFTLHEQLARTLSGPAARRQYELWLAFEQTALQRSNAVWTMSGRDRALALEHGAPRDSTFVVPNGVDLRRFQPVRRQTQERAVLFVGSFRHLPNLLAFEALRETIMPAVWKALPEVKLHVIAGPHHDRAARDAKKLALLAPDARIRIQGFVEDVRPAYRECDVAAIPLPVSAGTNIKLMEAMACGRAVISTPVGCQGLDLQDELDLLIRDVGPGFAEAIIRLLKDDSLRIRMASRARQVAESQFSWDSIAVAAFETYGVFLNPLLRSASQEREGVGCPE